MKIGDKFEVKSQPNVTPIRFVLTAIKKQPYGYVLEIFERKSMGLWEPANDTIEVEAEWFRQRKIKSI